MKFSRGLVTLQSTPNLLTIKRSFTYFKPLSALLLVISLLYILFAISQQTNKYSYNHINNTDQEISINYDYLVAPFDYFTIENALTSNNFKSVKNLSASFSQSIHWLKYQVTNNYSKNNNFVLHIDNPMLSTLELYEVNQTNTPGSLRTELLVNASVTTKITIDDDVFPHHQFYLKSGEQKTFLLKTQTLKHAYTPLLLYGEDDFLNIKHLSQIIYIVLISAILVIFFYNLVIYTALKDKIYLIYLTNLLGVFFILATTNGFGYYIFTPSVQFWLNTNSLLFHYVTILCLLFFTLYFFKYDEYKNKLYKITIYLACCYIAIAIASFIYDLNFHTKFFFASMPLLHLWCIILIIPRIKIDFTWARFYFLSWLPVFIGAVIQTLTSLNILEYSIFTRHAFLFGSFIEILCMACALAERIYRHERDRIKDICYHSESLIPRKVNLETTLKRLITEGNVSTHVLVISPENIDKITLYIDDASKLILIKSFYQGLSSQLNKRDDVVDLTTNREKICLLENNRFALLFMNDNQPDELSSLIELIQKTICDHYQVENFSITLSTEIGIAKYPQHGDSVDSLINHAHVACNNAEQSTNKWAFYLHKNSEKNHNFMILAKDLKDALTNNELEIYHQPQVDLKTLRVCGSECLLRWNHKTLGSIAPTLFISIAENIGLINQLTLWIVEKSLNQHAQITENETFNHMVSINISGKDVESETFFTDVTKIIEASNISPDKIIFEITESSAIINNKYAVEVIEKLTSVGITISIDDFGTGYSSLAYINTLPFQELKIDRQFVEGVCEDPKRKVIAENSVKLAKDLGLEVVAEGVNSKRDEDTLRQFGCDIGQGYYYARPMPLSDYIDWLSNQVNAQIPESYYGEFIPAEKNV